MDRRIAKTKRAIFQAFLTLLNDKGYDDMRVQDVIDLADVGRSTFYAHYASKEALLEELCHDLFHHLFTGREDADVKTLLAHIFKHFRTNQDRVASLLLSRNAYFLRELEAELKHDIFPKVVEDYMQGKGNLPEDLLVHFVVTTFVETVSWWLQQRKKVDEATLTEYYVRLLA
ncbi:MULTISPECIES: TetR/AcrR family transcriptional regulator [Streptococcus]|uniref:AraC family transcriptional regulator n=2 Tax=Streptococcus TaxID=1301 RepID=A0A0Z8EJE2_STRSU|nr:MULTISPECIES: TetR/AcrR family transcriptional regulator [Streptococcus]MBM0195758.1 TetR/AcrR family transcriptional regulator [Streptococcus suis]MBM7205224.1 TetR/AcrR family transcriptional regulator [Streptococcus suis]MBM7316896.1 TetR/AcrR family transcriptional regulator [Streptococcus suis]MBY4965850.1 TetR/AcrR family transcriptional regulator [Streptococcus suis]MCK4019828.1 TetR/AcrR family transcriptional regulator [Streptococcus suis]